MAWARLSSSRSPSLIAQRLPLTGGIGGRALDGIHGAMREKGPRLLTASWKNDPKINTAKIKVISTYSLFWGWFLHFRLKVKIFFLTTAHHATKTKRLSPSKVDPLAQLAILELAPPLVSMGKSQIIVQVSNGKCKQIKKPKSHNLRLW